MIPMVLMAGQSERRKEAQYYSRGESSEPQS